MLAFLNGDEVKTGAGLVVSTWLSVGRQGAGERSLLGPYLEGREIQVAQLQGNWAPV